MRFNILVPDATVNYIKNPSVRYDTTDWNASGATLTRTLDYARFGISSLKVVTAGTALREGAYYRVNALTTIAGTGSPITVSAYVRGTGMVRIRVIDSPAGQEWASQKVQVRSDRWTRLSISGMIKGSNDVRLYVETNETRAVSRTFYIDGAQMELKSYASTYCDGDQDGCMWNGIYHASTSQRSFNSRAGGRWVQLAGEERELQDLYMTVVGGLGMAPITNNIQSYALAPGAYFQNNKIEERTITLTFHAKHENLFNRSKELTLSALHQLRQMLIDVIKPDLTVGNEPIWFEYDNGETPVRFQARYDGGLEGDWDIRNQWTNSFPLRLLAVDPFLYEDNQNVSALDFQDSMVANYVVGRINGVWNRMNYGMDNLVRGFALGPRGELYAAGKFAKINNNALAVDPQVTANGVAYWDGEKWNRLGSGMNVLDDYEAVAVAPNGYVYVTGNFTSIGGVAANRVAYWNGSAWNAMGTGLNANGKTIAVAPNGDVYVGGTFTTAGGINCYRIARWDGTKWNRVGQFGGMDERVNSIVISKDGSSLYCGGQFSKEEGTVTGVNDMNAVAVYNTNTGLFSAMGDGFDSSALTGRNVSSLALTSSNVLYATGYFIYSGTTLMNGVARWVGGVWEAMGTGIDAIANGNQGNVLALDSSDNVYIGGSFSIIDGFESYRLALWNGTNWVYMDMSAISTSVNAIFVHPTNGQIFIGTNTSVQVWTAGVTTVQNSGTAEVSPVVYISGPGKLRRIENQRTGRAVFLELDIVSGEEITIDFGRGTMLSNTRNSVLDALQPGSDFHGFTLLPGDNSISCFMVNDVGAQMTLQYQPVHWSADAVQSVESL